MTEKWIMEIWAFLRFSAHSQKIKRTGFSVFTVQNKWKRNSPNFVLCSCENLTKVHHEISSCRNFAWPKIRMHEISPERKTKRKRTDCNETRYYVYACCDHLQRSIQIERSSMLVIVQNLPSWKGWRNNEKKNMLVSKSSMDQDSVTWMLMHFHVDSVKVDF